MIGFIGTVNYNSSHIELLLNKLRLLSMKNLSTSRMNTLLYLQRSPNISHHIERLIVFCCSLCFHGNMRAWTALHFVMSIVNTGNEMPKV
jgi:hypothetical protein